MELSMTTVIIIILGVTLLSLGLIFIRGIFTQIEDITKKTFEQADEEIKEYMATSDDKFYLLSGETTMEGGESQTMYTGIKNTGTGTIAITITSVKADAAEKIADNKIVIEASALSVTIGADEVDTIPFTITVPKGHLEGNFMFKIQAKSEGEIDPYGEKILIVQVE